MTQIPRLILHKQDEGVSAWNKACFAVSDHFSLPDHSIRDIELIPLELIYSDRDGIRKAREGF